MSIDELPEFCKYNDFADKQDPLELSEDEPQYLSTGVSPNQPESRVIKAKLEVRKTQNKRKGSSSVLVKVFNSPTKNISTRTMNRLRLGPSRIVENELLSPMGIFESESVSPSSSRSSSPNGSSPNDPVLKSKIKCIRAKLNCQLARSKLGQKMTSKLSSKFLDYLTPPSKMYRHNPNLNQVALLSGEKSDQ